MSQGGEIKRCYKALHLFHLQHMFCWINCTFHSSLSRQAAALCWNLWHRKWICSNVHFGFPIVSKVWFTKYMYTEPPSIAPRTLLVNFASVQFPLMKSMTENVLSLKASWVNITMLENQSISCVSIEGPCLTFLPGFFRIFGHRIPSGDFAQNCFAWFSQFYVRCVLILVASCLQESALAVLLHFEYLFQKCYYFQLQQPFALAPQNATLLSVLGF